MSIQQATEDCQTILDLPDLETGYWYESPDGKTRRYVYEISTSGLCRVGVHPRAVVAYTTFVGWKKLPEDHKELKDYAEKYGYVFKAKPD